jgi:Zn-dependent protease
MLGFNYSTRLFIKSEVPMKILDLLRTSPLEALIFLFSIIIAITVHEFAHAWTADRLGDDTPSLQGRVTLNPLAHLDPMGSLMFLLLGFGWGKPVIYNPMRLSRRSDELLIALAGPASNLILATVLNVIVTNMHRHGLYNTDVLQLASDLNILLAAFNMIPIPPLDGSSIIAYFWPEYRSLIGGQIGTVILLLVIFVPVLGGATILSAVLTPIQYIFYLVTHLFGLLG